MKTVAWTLIAAMVVATVPAVAQEEGADFERMAESQELYDRMEMYKQLGMEEGPALFMSILTSGKVDPAQMMLLMMMMDRDGIDDDGLGGLMFMNALSGQRAVKQPVVLDRGEELLIIEDGVLYSINLEDMELEASVAYVEGAQGNAAAMMAILAPVLANAKEKALQTACMSNVRQLTLAAHMYMHDAEGALPGETWAEQLFPYLKNRQLLRCPSRPDLPVGYAMNEKLLGAWKADIKRPTETVLLFESNIGGDNPIGGSDDVPEEGVHLGGIVVGFVFGNVKWMPVAQARDLLEQEVF